MSSRTVYSPYIPLLTGFHITSANHIDNRTVVETIEERDAINTLRLPEGIECLIMEAVRNGQDVVRYRWYDGEWHPISYGGFDFNHTEPFTIDDWILDETKDFNKYYIEVVHDGNKYPSHMVFTTDGQSVMLEYKEISTSTFRLYNRHPFDGTLTAN